MAQRTKTTLGIDEAGRGPAIGPMVLAAVVLDSRGAAALTRRGLRDSKAFGAGETARRVRSELNDLVRDRALSVVVRIVDVAEVDARVSRGELNELEREIACTLIERSPRVDRIVADGQRLFAPLSQRYEGLEALDRAESRHAAVAAASVVAKHHRDRLWGCIRRRYRCYFGDIEGGGYGNAKTQSFLRAYAERFRRLPPEARRSWPYPYLTDLLGEEVGKSAKARSSQLSLL